MKHIMNYIISIFIGAVIGYVTNWLAIKMLFRPHKEKRIFGKRLPFTPGLIPKERYRISASVGKTIGEHLLTKETLVEALANEKMDNHIKKWISEKVRGIKSNSTSLKELLKNALGNRYDKLIENIKLRAVAKIREVVLSSAGRDKFETVLKEFIYKICKMSMEEITNSGYMSQAKEFTIDKIKKLKDSDSFKIKLKGYIENGMGSLENSDKAIRDIIPEGITASIKVYVYSSRKDICETIQEMLKQPSVSERLKSAISSMINTNLNPLVAAFIKVDTVYAKLIGALEEYFKEDENQRNIALLINDGIDKLTKEKITELFKKVSVEDRTIVTEGLVTLLSEKVLTDAFIENIFRELEQSTSKYTTLDELLSTINDNYVDLSSDFILKKLVEFAEGERFSDLLESLLSKLIEELLKVSPAQLIGEEVDVVIDIATEAWESIFNKFLEKDALAVIEAMDIPKIVEERINSFDVAFAEEIIISIAKRELNAITLLGAFLGAIMGILSPLLSALYR
ncbi:DUF445 family protein [Clostridium thermarum]|uniref:DUF445 family protein n=1 Tax=Clostridium thermarum TaxID=1716543 RepID=UPI0013D08B4E|nr:DUF445 family protein [Clostridium thermarum]